MAGCTVWQISIGGMAIGCLGDVAFEQGQWDWGDGESSIVLEGLEDDEFLIASSTSLGSELDFRSLSTSCATSGEINCRWWRSASCAVICSRRTLFSRLKTVGFLAS